MPSTGWPSEAGKRTRSARGAAGAGELATGAAGRSSPPQAPSASASPAAAVAVRLHMPGDDRGSAPSTASASPGPRRRARPRIAGARVGGMPRRRQDARELVRVYTDPLQHALIAAAVTAPLAVRAGRGVIGTAVAAALVIDVDHAVAARSVRVRDTTALGAPSAQPQPRHRGARRGASSAPPPARCTAGRRSAASSSHLLHDAGDTAAPTPVLWPSRPPRQLGRRVQVAGTALLTMGSTILAAGCAGSPSRPRGAAGAGDGTAARSPRTA